MNEWSPWMIFPESARRVWIFDGAKDVTLIEINDDGGSKITSSQVVPDILRRAPKTFAQRLPEQLNKNPV